MVYILPQTQSVPNVSLSLLTSHWGQVSSSPAEIVSDP